MLVSIMAFMKKYIENDDVIPSLTSDQSAIMISINGIENISRGPLVRI